MEHLLQFFEYKHLPQPLQAAVVPFKAMAHAMYATLPTNPESTMAMRKLLEAKDCAVRSLLYVTPNPADLPPRDRNADTRNDPSKNN